MILFFTIGIHVVQNIVRYMMDFVFSLLLIRASADEVVLVKFIVFPIRCRIYHDPLWTRQLPPPPPLLSEDFQCQIDNINHGCKNPRRPVTQTNKFCTLAPNVCGSSIWNCLYVSLLAPGILRWFLDFWQRCGHLTYTLHVMEHNSRLVLLWNKNSVVSSSRFPNRVSSFCTSVSCRFYIRFV